MTIWRWWRSVGPTCRAGPEPASDADPRSRSASGTYQRFRFSLRDLLLLMVVVGVIAWIVTGFAGIGLLIEWPGAIVASLLLAGLTIAAWNVVAARRKWPAIGLLLFTFAAVIATEVAVLGNWLKISEFLVTAQSLQWWRHDAAILSFLYGELTGMLLIALVLTQAAFTAEVRGIVRRASQVAIAATCILAAIPLATLYWRMTGIPEFPPPLSLAENPYPQILESGASMELAGPTQAAAIYQELLPLLDRPGYVPMDLSDVATDPLTHKRLVAIQQVRSIARAIDAQGDTLDVQGKHDEAADYSHSILKLVHMQSRGDIQIDKLVGEAMESVGRHRLIVHREKRSRESKLKLMEFLQDLDGSRESISLVRQRDDAFYARSERWRFALERQLPFHWFGLARDGGDYIDKQLFDSQIRHQAVCRLLYTDLAIRLFQEDHGRLPQLLDELVPEYLAEVPIDPYADKPFTYRTAGDTFTLYSIGPDCQDNGGVTAKPVQNVYSTPGIDWDLDSLVAP
jgi:hypothetical protein